MTTARKTYLGVVYPWQCDAIGHLTTRFYMAAFDESSWHFLREAGYDPAMLEQDRIGWADVRHEIDYLRELAAGELYYIESRPLRIGNSSVVYEMAMKTSRDDEPCARLVATTVQFDLNERRSTPLLPAVRERLQEWLG